MAHHQITLDDQVIQALAGQKDDALAILVQQVLNQVLEAQVADQLQAVATNAPRPVKAIAMVRAPAS